MLSVITETLGDFVDGASFTYIDANASVNIDNSTLTATGTGLEAVKDEDGNTVKNEDGTDKTELGNNLTIKATASVESELKGEAGTGNFMGGYTNADAAVIINATEITSDEANVAITSEAKNVFKINNAKAEEETTTTGSTAGGAQDGDGGTGTDGAENAGSGEGTGSTPSDEDDGDKPSEDPKLDLTNNAVGAMVGVSKTTAAVNIDTKTGGAASEITGENSVKISASAESELAVENTMSGAKEAADDKKDEAADTTPATDKKESAGGMSVGMNALSATVAVSTTEATVNIGDKSTEITAKEDIEILANTSSKLTSNNTMSSKKDEEDDKKEEENKATEGDQSAAKTAESAKDDSSAAAEESKVSLGVAFGLANGSASVNIGSGNKIEAGNDITVSAEGKKEIAVTADVSGKGKYVAASVGMAMSNMQATLTSAADFTAGNDLNIGAKVEVEENSLTVKNEITTQQTSKTTATEDGKEDAVSEAKAADTGSNNTKADSLQSKLLEELKNNKRFKEAGAATGAKEEEPAPAASDSTQGTSGTGDSSGGGTTNSTSLNAATGVAIHTNTANVEITSGTLAADNDVNVTAEISDAMSNQAIAAQKVEEAESKDSTAKEGEAGTTTEKEVVNGQKNALAAAIMYGSTKNNNAIIIGKETDPAVAIEAGNNLNLEAKTEFASKVSDTVDKVNEIKDAVTSFDDFSIEKIETSYNNIKEVKEAVAKIKEDPSEAANTYVQSTSTAENVAGAVSVGVFDMENNTTITIANATLTADKDLAGASDGKGGVTATATNEIHTINLVGKELPVGEADDDAEKAANGVGGSVLVALYENNAEVVIKNVTITGSDIMEADEENEDGPQIKSGTAIKIAAENTAININSEIGRASCRERVLRLV